MIKFIPILILFSLLAACQKTEVIFDAKPNENLDLPLILSLDDKNCVFDVQRGLLKYSIDESSLENFSPYVEHQTYSIVKFNNETLANKEINNLGNIEYNKAYNITIITEDETNEFSLFFTSIPIVQIVTYSPIINGPKTLSRIILNYPESGRKSDNNWAGIEQRGKSSLDYDKKSFGIEILADKGKKKTILHSYFDLKPNRKWILDAMFIDQSRLRNKSSFELWTSLTTPENHIGIKSNFVEVFINYESQGIYCLAENYTEDLLDLNNQSVLYKSTDNSLITKFNNLPKNDPNNIYWGDWEQKYPIPSETIVWTDFEAFCELVVNGSDADFKTNISHQIDLDNVIDYYLFINLCGGIDNVGKNCYFLKQDHSTKFKIVPWDMDGTWGRNPFAEELGYSGIYTNALFNRLEETNPENYNSRLKERWHELRLLEFAEINLIELFSKNFDELTSYEIIDLENNLWYLQLSLENEQIYITNWISNRLTFLDEYFEL